MILLQLFWEFFKTGLFAIGGGLATVPFLQDISAKTGWYTAGQLADMIAVSESTPGPMGVNMATMLMPSSLARAPMWAMTRVQSGSASSFRLSLGKKPTSHSSGSRITSGCSFAA